MCGITGYWDLSGAPLAPDAETQISRMTDCIRHRGPDSGGTWLDGQAGLALGHRRLAIRDLSPAGHQPMLSADGRYVIVYNGEVYNADELSADLAPRGIPFRGHSDTEVILEACAAWGVQRTVKRLIGMFAFALWDRQKRTLTLVRDRLGIKPLYWAHMNGHFFFGSELSSMREHPKFSFSIDRSALTAFMYFAYVPAPQSIHKNCHKLPPAHILTVTASGSTTLEPYWDPLEIATQGCANPLGLSTEEAVDTLEDLLTDAVQRRLVADVPLGAFLSGGIDSSLVVALMQKVSSEPVRTFSIGFLEAGFDEAPFAKAVAKHLGTDHTELYVTPAEAQGVIPKLADIYDEPFADSSQIPTFLVSELARKHVTITLSGDGGDELFAGYTRYFNFGSVFKSHEILPRSLRQLMARGLRTPRPVDWDRLAKLALWKFRPQRFGERVHSMANMLAKESSDLYRQFVSHWQEPHKLVVGGTLPPDIFSDQTICGRFHKPVELMQYLDVATYLPGDILTKVDRASMAVSLESRVPLLDHRVYELAWRLPSGAKYVGDNGKIILRRILARHVPMHLFERPKMGFGVPIGVWLTGPLRDWAEDLLDESRLKQEGYLNPAMVRHYWDRHLSGEMWHYWIWNVLMFQAWKERYKPQ